MFDRAGNVRDHIKDLRSKEIIAAKTTRSLGKKRCKSDFMRRKMLIEYLAKSSMSYEVEIFGWSNYES